MKFEETHMQKRLFWLDHAEDQFRVYVTSGNHLWSLIVSAYQFDEDPWRSPIQTQTPVKMRQNRWAHLDQFNLGFTPKAACLRTVPYLHITKSPLFPRQPLKYRVLDFCKKSHWWASAALLVPTPGLLFSGIFRGCLSYSGSKNSRHYLWWNPFGVNHHPVSRCPLAGFLRYFGNTHFNPSSIWYPYFQLKRDRLKAI